MTNYPFISARFIGLYFNSISQSVFQSYFAKHISIVFHEVYFNLISNLFPNTNLFSNQIFFQLRYRNFFEVENTGCQSCICLAKGKHILEM